MLRLLVTTGLRASATHSFMAQILSRDLGAPYVPREGRSLAALQSSYGVDAVVVAGGRRVSLFLAGQEFFFHPGMAKVRIRELKTGKTDQMVKAMGLGAGDSVLDCTLGLGTDAVVASYVVGPRGVIVGLEVSRPLCVLVRHGLRSYEGRRGESGAVLSAMRRINVHCGEHLAFLTGLPDAAFDVVYFDPMFRRPLRKSSGIEPVRPLAAAGPLTKAVLAEARRVAARCVVFKERRGDGEFRRLGFTAIEGGRYSPVAYGIMLRGRDF